MRGPRVTFALLATASLVFFCLAGESVARDAAGHVFEDQDADGARDPGEPGVAGVAVSNGRDVVVTDDEGAYVLGVSAGDVIFITKPSGYAVPTDSNNLPRFYYLHAPEGTPAELGLRYKGLDPTGPLPDRIDFALTPAVEHERFDVVLLADPQPQTSTELTWFRDDVADELIGIQAAFGMTLGDIMYDDLSMFPRYVRILSRIGLPWYHVVGNHDLNLLAPSDRYSVETFKRHFGPPYYSFDYAGAHFVVLDDVFYKGSNVGQEKPHPKGQGLYAGLIGETQLNWLRQDLAQVSTDRLVVLAMHIPFLSYNRSDQPQRRVDDRDELFALLEGRRHVFSIAGHMHTTEHHYYDDDDGFTGPEPLHQHVLATASGSWWSGPRDERGIPVTWQRDGSPNGYHVMTVDGTGYSLRYKAAGEPADYQMQIMLDSSYHAYHEDGRRDTRMGELLGSPIHQEQLHSTQVLVNLFDGGPRSILTLRVDDALPVVMERIERADPFFAELLSRTAATWKSWVKVEPSSHLWAGKLPRSLAPGVHTLTVQASDEYGQRHEEHKIFEIVGSTPGTPEEE